MYIYIYEFKNHNNHTIFTCSHTTPIYSLVKNPLTSPFWCCHFFPFRKVPKAAFPGPSPCLAMGEMIRMPHGEADCCEEVEWGMFVSRFWKMCWAVVYSPGFQSPPGFWRVFFRGCLKQTSFPLLLGGVVQPKRCWDSYHSCKWKPTDPFEPNPSDLGFQVYEFSWRER